MKRIFLAALGAAMLMGATLAPWDAAAQVIIIDPPVVTCPPACGPPPVDPTPVVPPVPPAIQDNEVGRVHLRFQDGQYHTALPTDAKKLGSVHGVCRQKDLRARWYCELREVNRGNPRATVMADVDQICRVGNEAARWQCLRRIRLVYPEIPGCKKTATGRGASTHFAWGLCDDISYGTPLGTYRVANVAKVVGTGAQARVVLSAGPRQYWLRQWPAQVAAHHPARKANGVRKTPRIRAPALDYLVLAQ